MKQASYYSSPRRALARGAVVLSLSVLAGAVPAFAQKLYPGNLVLSRSVYDNNANNVKVGQILPPGCATTTGSCSASTGAPDNGTYPFVFNNDLYDGSFGITSKIFLDQIDLFGGLVNTIEVPNSDQFRVGNQLVTSFSSKSELALHRSTSDQYLTFMGYVAPANSLDVSNSNTPGVVDPSNPDALTAYRAVATLGLNGKFTFTETNAYSGNNGRAAILNDSNGANVFYTAGNAGNGGKVQPAGVVAGAGAQFIVPATAAEASQTPGQPTPIGSFSLAELGVPADKIGKDDNFRGMAVFNHVLYYTKGSGSNGVNTVYFVDTTGNACPRGVGLPVAGAVLPSAPISYSSSVVTTGLTSNMCILAGFPTTPAKTAAPPAYPFSLFFANAHTLYVADEGDGYAGAGDLYTHAAAQTTAGLQKWVFNTATQTWKLAYTLKNGLALGQPYPVANYIGGTNPATNLPWTPATDGLRNITGLVSPLGLTAIWGVTSTISGNGDVGADPNRLFVIVDVTGNTDPAIAAKESFIPVKDAHAGEVFRGISFTPGSETGGSR